MQIVTRFPVVDVDGTLVTLVVGKAEVEFGDEVSLDTVFDRKVLTGLYVAGVDTAPANEVSAEVLALFGIATTEALLGVLSRKYGTGLPHDVTVTIYTLVDGPVEDLTFSEGD